MSASAHHGSTRRTTIVPGARRSIPCWWRWAWFFVDPGRRPVDQWPRLGRVFAAARAWSSGCSTFVLRQWFGEAAIAEDRGRPVFSERIDVSYRWSMSLVHLLGGDVLRRRSSVPCTGRGCIRCRCLGSAGPRSSCGPISSAAWPSACWPAATASPAGTVEPFRDDGAVAAADDQHRAAAHLGRDADLRAPCADRQPARIDQCVAWMWLTVLLWARSFLCVPGL